jgi:hypothetical protein
MLSNEFGPRRASVGVRFAGIRRDRQIPALMTFPDAAPAGLTASSSTATRARSRVEDVAQFFRHTLPPHSRIGGDPT